ncbi:MAG: T9SS type A sorting domain-containing protein [Ignavibacteriales bacterium]|nr:T9SS type A sorting domain-containing protein [Ignavibacteriales bacterium]
MKNLVRTFFIFFLLFFISNFAQQKIINHNCTDISQIPESAIIQAKEQLHIAYGHTSHGSQITTGMSSLDNFMGGTGLYNWHDGIEDGSLDLDDYFVSGDLGNPDRTTWAERTREYLNNSNNSDVNVVMWSWCGQASSATVEDINTYLNLMTTLENEFPQLIFVYMTGHLDGSGLDGNLHLRNEQIRNYCKANNKYLFDFADIECYDPDGNYYGDKNPTDACNYNDNGTSRNWAVEWQDNHTEGVDWYNCSSAHSEPLNANQKAYAAWWLWASIAGWESGVANVDYHSIPINIELANNYPNPFNPITIIPFSISATNDNQSEFAQGINVSIKVYNILGSEVANLLHERINPGKYEIKFDAGSLSSGIYYYTLTTGNFTQTKRMILMK